MSSSAVETVKLPDAPRASGSAIVLQHPAAKAVLERAVAKTASQPFLDDNTHNGWLDCLGLNA